MGGFFTFSRGFFHCHFCDFVHGRRLPVGAWQGGYWEVACWSTGAHIWTLFFGIEKRRPVKTAEAREGSRFNLVRTKNVFQNIYTIVRIDTYVYVYIHICVSMYVYIYICTRIYKYIYIYVYMYECVFLYQYFHKHLYMYMYTCLHVCLFESTCISICT